jgi:hypothetical protein
VESLHVIQSVVSVVAGLAASYGVGLFLCRLGLKLYQAWRVVGDLHREFGPSPVGELLDVLRSIEASHGEIEVRQRLAERHLEFGIFVATPAGQWTWANAWLCQSFGVDSTELRHNGWVQALADSEQVTEHEHWLRCINESLPYERTYTVEPHNRTSGAWKASTEAWPVTDRSGEIICYVGYVVDALRKWKHEGECHGSEH